MNSNRLSPLQWRVLALLAGMDPSWTLTGGGALAGIHLGHRTTRDLDLFWLGHDTLGEARREVLSRLRAAGLAVTEVRATDSFSAVRVESGGEAVVVDLVAEPVRSIDPPTRIELGGASILVDTPYEILVNKLCALLHRSELRDLQDIKALIATGLDLDKALSDAPKKDGGFSGLTLGFSLKSWPIRDAARAAGLAERGAELERFRDELLARVAGR